MRKVFLEKDDFANDYSYDDNEQWLIAGKKEKFLASLAFSCGRYFIAYDLCERLFKEKKFDDDNFVDFCLQNLSRFFLKFP